MANLPFQKEWLLQKPKYQLHQRVKILELNTTARVIGLQQIADGSVSAWVYQINICKDEDSLFGWFREEELQKDQDSYKVYLIEGRNTFHGVWVSSISEAMEHFKKHAEYASSQYQEYGKKIEVCIRCWPSTDIDEIEESCICEEFNPLKSCALSQTD
jgi:hypothetical protein